MGLNSKENTFEFSGDDCDYQCSKCFYCLQGTTCWRPSRCSRTARPWRGRGSLRLASGTWTASGFSAWPGSSPDTATNSCLVLPVSVAIFFLLWWVGDLHADEECLILARVAECAKQGNHLHQNITQAQRTAAAVNLNLFPWLVFCSKPNCPDFRIRWIRLHGKKHCIDRKKNMKSQKFVRNDPKVVSTVFELHVAHCNKSLFPWELKREGQL